MRKTAPDNAIRELHRKARRIAQTFSVLFDAPPSSRIVLAPGILVGLQVLFAKLQVRRILLGDGEYYGAPHFPVQRVFSGDVDQLLKLTKECRPDAVIVSVVTWRGKVLPCAKLFSEIRRARRRERAPLLVADYSHAGAIGFPSVKKLGADLVCGGPGKWLTPPTWDSKLAFLWFASSSLFSEAKVAFAPFFLALDQEPPFLVSRWIDPGEIRALDAWLRNQRLNRAALKARHRADREVASRLAARFEMDCPESNILWLPRRHAADRIVEKLDRLGLVWRMPDGKIRILCRAEAM